MSPGFNFLAAQIFLNLRLNSEIESKKEFRFISNHKYLVK